MKRLLLAPLLMTLVSCSNPVVDEEQINRKAAEFCMKAADFAGCVQTMSGEGETNKKIEIISNKKQDLLDEIKKIPSRIANTSMRDYSSRTMDFTDALALSSPDEVGQKLYQDAEKLRLTLDLLYATWERDLKTRSGAMYREYGVEGSWSYEKNLQLKTILDEMYGVNTIDIRCTYKILGVRGVDILEEMVAFTNLIARNIATNNELNLPDNEGKALISQQGKFCPGDPRKAQKKKTPVSSTMDIE
tara:strand:+ start:173 stop:910 length:738 start_codon:yes stop_codon:yes gene_type:complete